MKRLGFSCLHVRAVKDNIDTIPQLEEFNIYIELSEEVLTNEQVMPISMTKGEFPLFETRKFSTNISGT